MTDEADKPPRFPPRLIGAPKIRQFYWCDFPKDAHLPEFWKRRPVLIVSFRNVLHGTVSVIPCSSQDQGDNPWAVKLATSIDGFPSWAVCDKITSVAVSRLHPERKGIVRATEFEFNHVLRVLLKWLPAVPLTEPTKG